MRAKMVAVLQQEFSNFEFTYSVGGQISFDVRLPGLRELPGLSAHAHVLHLAPRRA